MHKDVDAVAVRPKTKDLPSKNRVWGFRTPARARIRKAATQAAESRRENAPVPTITVPGISQFLLTDQVGTLRAVADSTGTIVKSVDYDSFGNIIADSNPSFTVPFGFAGGLHDRDTGLVRFGYRDYSPELGRFVAKDPIDFAGGDTNLYAYSMSDPVNYVDPYGLKVVAGSPELSGFVQTLIDSSRMVQYLDSLPQNFVVKYGYAPKGPQYQSDKCGGGTVALPDRADYPAVMGTWPGAPVVTSQYRSMTHDQIILTNIAHELGHAYFTTRYGDSSQNSAIGFENVLRGRLGIGAIRPSER